MWPAPLDRDTTGYLDIHSSGGTLTNDPKPGGCFSLTQALSRTRDPGLWPWALRLIVFLPRCSSVSPTCALLKRGENIMNPTFCPSLQHVAAVQIALTLYKHKDIQHLLDEFDCRFPSAYTTDETLQHIFGVPCTKDEDGWKEVKKTAMEILPDFLATNHKVKVANMIRPLHWEYKKWVTDHNFLRHLTSKEHLNFICWKSEGTINRIRTAQNFIREGNFLMACVYFMEKEIMELNPNKRILSLNIIINFWMEWLHRINEKPVTPWPEKLDEWFRNPDFYGYIPIRVSSFFHLLSRENRRNCFPLFGQEKSLDGDLRLNLNWERRRGFFPLYKQNTAHDDDLRLCLNLMDKEERILLFRCRPSSVLRSFLKWPYHDIFMEMANQMWPYISIDCFEDILRYILSVPPGLEDVCCLKIFKEFWDESPYSYKEQIKNSYILKWVKRAET
ncbi:hypothetical protein AVEN_176408-1 [Araneus ventricosus]|uniref:Uncharacterized protein n=1 Tax=Araneus ventricosus TaxID=182803 RepID=A0A4Y2C740_ARAVE|nr:hypothetical protein AVEN_176408-1 [Araneus ventricosus]